eukprot:1159215-Pelagomonas_calceolata.AAC.1
MKHSLLLLYKRYRWGAACSTDFEGGLLGGKTAQGVADPHAGTPAAMHQAVQASPQVHHEPLQPVCKQGRLRWGCGS